MRIRPTHRRGKAFERALSLSAVSLLMACLTWAGTKPAVASASFNTDGSVNIPVGYRQWAHVGTRYKTKGSLSILDNMPIKTPEILNAYVAPVATQNVSLLAGSKCLI